MGEGAGARITSPLTARKHPLNYTWDEGWSQLCLSREDHQSMILSCRSSRLRRATALARSAAASRLMNRPRKVQFGSPSPHRKQEDGKDDRPKAKSVDQATGLAPADSTC